MLILHRKHGERVVLLHGDSLASVELLDSSRREAKLSLESDGDRNEVWVAVDQSAVVILAGQPVEVMVLDLPGSRSARLGFTADKSVTIYRQELLEKKEAKNG